MSPEEVKKRELESSTVQETEVKLDLPYEGKTSIKIKSAPKYMAKFWVSIYHTYGEDGSEGVHGDAYVAPVSDSERTLPRIQLKDLPNVEVNLLSPNHLKLSRTTDPPFSCIVTAPTHYWDTLHGEYIPPRPTLTGLATDASDGDGDSDGLEDPARHISDWVEGIYADEDDDEEVKAALGLRPSDKAAKLGEATKGTKQTQQEMPVAATSDTLSALRGPVKVRKTIHSVSVNSNGKGISGGDDGTVRVWNAHTGELYKDLRESEAGRKYRKRLERERRMRTLRRNPEPGTEARDEFDTEWEPPQPISVVEQFERAFGEKSHTDYYNDEGDEEHEEANESIIDPPVTLNDRGHVGAVYVTQWFPSNLVALTAGADRTIRIWAVEPARCVRTLVGHERGITRVAMLPGSGRNFYSSSLDGTIRLWDTGTGACIQTFAYKTQLQQFYATQQRHGASGEPADEYDAIRDITLLSSDAIGSGSSTEAGSTLVLAGTDSGHLRIFDPRANTTTASSDPSSATCTCKPVVDLSSIALLPSRADHLRSQFADSALGAAVNAVAISTLSEHIVYAGLECGALMTVDLRNPRSALEMNHITGDAVSRLVVQPGLKSTTSDTRPNDNLFFATNNGLAAILAANPLVSPPDSLRFRSTLTGVDVMRVNDICWRPPADTSASATSMGHAWVASADGIRRYELWNDLSMDTEGTMGL